MNYKILHILLLLVFTGLIYCCGGEEEEVPDDLVFHSLVAERDTIAPGEQVKVKANATGSKLEYYWSATLGDILNSGPEVIYAASPCQVGKNQITCKITNGPNQSETKSIYIVVYE
jgi:hypothetical protein